MCQNSIFVFWPGTAFRLSMPLLIKAKENVFVWKSIKKIWSIRVNWDSNINQSLDISQFIIFLGLIEI